jgi:hypothetical protein
MIGILVRVLDYRWNRFQTSLYLLQAKLENCGLTYADNTVKHYKVEKKSDV